MAPSNRVRLDVRRLRDESVAQEYKRELAESLGEPNDSDDPEEIWTDFEESRRARLEGRTGQYRELKSEAVRAVRRDKEASRKSKASCKNLTFVTNEGGLRRALIAWDDRL